MALTKLMDLIDPEVLAPMLDATIESQLVATPFARIDTTLQGSEGSTITVPKYAYIGDAEEVAEGVEVGTAKLEVTSSEYSVKKIAKDVEISDEALKSAYGNPQGQATTQLGVAIASKIDADVVTVAQSSNTAYTGTGIISYTEIVNALDLFQEEVCQEKVMFIAPKQRTQLRLDPEFKSKETYGNDVVMKGEIGMIAGVRIVVSKRVKVASGKYKNPIIQLNGEAMTDDVISAITVYLKSDTELETERLLANRSVRLASTKHYVVALTDATKVVVATLLATAPAPTE